MHRHVDGTAWYAQQCSQPYYIVHHPCASSNEEYGVEQASNHLRYVERHVQGLHNWRNLKTNSYTYQRGDALQQRQTCRQACSQNEFPFLAPHRQEQARPCLLFRHPYCRCCCVAKTSLASCDCKCTKKKDINILFKRFIPASGHSSCFKRHSNKRTSCE